MPRPKIELTAPVLDAPDARALADFYQSLLGWDRRADDDDWVILKEPDGERRLSFQTESAYVRPTWPAGPGDQQMQVHLDIAVDDLDGGVAWALELGATQAGYQPQDEVRVMLDPVGHPFCLFAYEFPEGS